MNPTQSDLPSYQPEEQTGPDPAGASAMPPAAQPVQFGSTPAAPPVAAAPAAGNAAWLPPSVPVQPSGGQANDNASTGSTAAVPAVADDGDLIEKEWVHRAKQIVERTRQDPYEQTKELHKFKAEYMKKRYNKIIEPVEE